MHAQVNLGKVEIVSTISGGLSLSYAGKGTFGAKIAGECRVFLSSLGLALAIIPWPRTSYHPLAASLAIIPCR